METVKVCCLPVDPQQFTSHSQYHRWLVSRLKELKTSGVQLALLPAYTGLIIFQANVGLPEPAWKQVLKRYWGNLELWNSIFVDIHSDCAKQSQMFLAAGTTWTNINGSPVHTAYFFGPNGELIGRQGQCHLNRRERNLMTRATDVSVWATDIGQIAMVVGTDIWYPEVSRILTLKGAQVLLAPVAYAAPFNRWLQVAGMWQEVQQNQVFALENWLEGHLFQQSFAGTANILAPCEITPGETGYLAQGGPGSKSDNLPVATLNFRHLEEIRKSYPLSKFLNRDLYSRYFPDIYRRQNGGRIAQDD